MNILDLAAKITLDSSEYENGLAKLGSAVSKGLKATAAAVTAASGAVVAFGKGAVDVGANFDKSMSQVAATMGVTVDELNNSVVSVGEFTGTLRDFAQQMGSTTAFSATQAADALNYMALAGYDAETSVSMLPNVLSLAAAGNMDLAVASDMVTDAQTALGLSLDETTIMVDQMAKASSKSNTSVSQLGEAFLTVGGNAKNLSGGTTELSQILGVLADNGIKGAEAGTHLRNIMLSMTPQTDAAVAAFEKLGLQSYDAMGNLRPLEDIFTDLSDSMSDMTTQEKTEMLSSIFNKTDLAAVNALLSTSADRYDELFASIEDSTGAASEMASTQLDNLTGDVTLFKSALEGVQIAVSDKVTPTLRTFVQTGSEGLSEIASALTSGDIDGAFEAIGDTIGNLVGNAIDILPDIVTVAIEVLDSIMSVIVEKLPAIIQMIVDQLPTIVNNVNTLLVNVITAIAQSAPEILASIASLLSNLLSSLTDNSSAVINAIKACLLSVIQTIIDNGPELLTQGIELLLQLARGIAEALPQLIPQAMNAITTLVITLTEPDNIQRLIEASILIMGAIIEGLLNSIPNLIEAVPYIILGLAKGIDDGLGNIFTKGIELLDELIDGFLDGITSAWAAAGQIVDEIIDGIANGFNSVYDVGANLIKGLWNGIASVKDWIWDHISGFFGDVWDGICDFFGIASPSKKMAWVGDMIGEGMANGITDSVDDVVAEATALSDSVADALSINEDINGGYEVDIANPSNIVVQVYGAQGQDAEELAEIVSQKIAEEYDRGKVVWA